MGEGNGNLIIWIVVGVIAFAVITLTLKRRAQRSGGRRRHHFDHKSADAHKVDLESSTQEFGGLTPEIDAEIRAYMRAGKKINAIKIYRDATGAGLKESKEAVERDYE